MNRRKREIQKLQKKMRQIEKPERKKPGEVDQLQ